MTVTVYTKDFCPQCSRVKAAFDKDGLEYVDLEHGALLAVLFVLALL